MVTRALSSHGPLSVQVDPPAPTVEQLWEGRVEMSVRGPAGRRVECAVSLRDTESAAATVTKKLPPLPLPVTADIWRRHFKRHFQETREAPRAYDTARVCEIEFTCEELGAFHVRCEREFTPLRWAVLRDGQRYLTRLLDDSGDTTPLQVVRMAFEAPMVEEPLELAQASDVPTASGMYVARRGAFSAAIIMPPMGRSFIDLRCVSHIDARERPQTRSSAPSRSPAPGAVRDSPETLFSATRQRGVLRALAAYIFRLIGGDTWALAELSSSNGPDGFARLKRAISKRREEVGIGAALTIDCAVLSAATCEERVQRVASLAREFHLLPSRPARRSPATAP